MVLLHLWIAQASWWLVIPSDSYFQFFLSTFAHFLCSLSWCCVPFLAFSLVLQGRLHIMTLQFGFPGGTGLCRHKLWLSHCKTSFWHFSPYKCFVLIFLFKALSSLNKPGTEFYSEFTLMLLSMVFNCLCCSGISEQWNSMPFLSLHFRQMWFV